MFILTKNKLDSEQFSNSLYVYEVGTLDILLRQTLKSLLILQ